MIASSCVVVWVVSGYDALIAQSIDESAAEALGRFDLVVSGGGGGPGVRPSPGAAPPGAASEARGGRDRGGESTLAGAAGRPGCGGRGGGQGGPGLGLPRPLIADLKGDERVAEANLTTQSRVSVGRAAPDPAAPPVSELMRGDRPPVNGMPPSSPPLIGTDATEPPYELASGRWIDPAAGGRAEGVLSADYAKGLNVEAGDDVKVNSEVGEWTVKLVGIVEQPRSGGGGGRGGGCRAPRPACSSPCPSPRPSTATPRGSGRSTSS